MADETYLGDGVYASCDGYHIWLKTQRENVWHSIALEPEVLNALIAYAQRIFSASFESADDD